MAIETHYGLDVRRDGDLLELVLSGAWTIDRAALLDGRLREIAAMDAGRIVIDASGLTALDSAGAWVIRRTDDSFAGRGKRVQLTGLADQYAALLEATRIEDPDSIVAERAPNVVAAVLGRCGEAVFRAGEVTRDLFGFFGFTLVALWGIPFGRTRIRWLPFLNQLELVGFNAIPIVGLLCFLVGIVLAYMGALQLERFGASILTVNLVGVSVLREIGVLLTAIIVAGRSGSAFTAQIGTMKVNQEVDAMETLGLSPVDVLVMPRLLGLLIALPLLVFFGDIAGLAGGAMIAVLRLDLTVAQFLVQLKDAVDFWDFATGMMKAPVFAYVIALVGCHQGLQVSGSAESVGIRTTAAVVQSIFLVIVLNAMFAIFFAELGI